MVYEVVAVLNDINEGIPDPPVNYVVRVIGFPSESL
jgi:hypothetical protein